MPRFILMNKKLIAFCLSLFVFGCSNNIDNNLSLEEISTISASQEDPSLMPIKKLVYDKLYNLGIPSYLKKLVPSDSKFQILHEDNWKWTQIKKVKADLYEFDATYYVYSKLDNKKSRFYTFSGLFDKKEDKIEVKSNISDWGVWSTQSEKITEIANKSLEYGLKVDQLSKYHKAKITKLYEAQVRYKNFADGNRETHYSLFMALESADGKHPRLYLKSVEIKDSVEIALAQEPLGSDSIKLIWSNDKYKALNW